MKYSNIFFCFIVGLTLHTTAWGKDFTQQKNLNGRDLTGYEPSYFVFAFDEDNHAEFKISVKYPLIKEFGSSFNNFTGGSNEFFFSYTGKYDFFLFSSEVAGRDSAPVVSRIQNPGLFLKNTRTLENNEGLETISIGWFHESNGQQISDNTTFNNTLNAEDFVSRGWDYLGLDFKYNQHKTWTFPDTINYYLRLRFFCDCQGFGLIDDREDDIRIFGGTEQAKISDYDGLRFIINNYSGENLFYSLNLKTGTSDIDALRKLTYTLEVTYKVLNIPFTLFYFKGYGKDISTYHIKDSYIGVGLRMW